VYEAGSVSASLPSSLSAALVACAATAAGLRGVQEETSAGEKMLVKAMLKFKDNMRLVG